MSVRQRLAAKRKNSQNMTLSVENESNSTNQSNPTSSSSSSKRQKIVTEKRLRRYRASMTIGIYDRIERALHQRLYLLAVTKSSNEPTYREYKVLGQTANVYTIIITHIPSCTCPDYAKGHLCKHIIFVLHRVLKVDRNSPLLYQQALLTNELNEIFAKADLQHNDSHILAEQSIREAYHAKTGDPNVILNSKKIQQKIITNDDECPICFESMINEKNNILFCSTSCGNNMHKKCFEQWRQAKLSMNELVTCPFCRIEWKTIIKRNKNQNDFLNLAAYATTHDYDEEDDDWMFFNYY
ncbi:unnamed protein product [Rotaria sordida]|uniref:Uncharacterized protein n=1 Tax=Rotaria sordida TaxID=392033 RepID=A0A814QV46_9BILA|nr:unnamed protein product [Rotaria sordida]CAF3952599.1 unnamed protein product [Rotaria sordida]